jgi:putative FmdB family regulatory protein
LPLYEYECPKDGTFEQVRKFSDPPLAACPTCGGPIEKLLSAPAIQFKGTGWYITDYARKGTGDGGKEGKEGKDKGKAKESPKEGSKESASAASAQTKASTSDTKSASSGSGEKK